ncbi:MAG: flagellar basal body P-ring protein FlgI [Planctomycetota bacterium]|nr:MAG: flagellar basal body P-ring protein FlgI [Planctomycetota bacterium]
MAICDKKSALITIILAIWFFIAGCAGTVERDRRELAPEIELGTTIGSLAEVFSPDLIAVEGYGLVGGLRATGSGECPPQIRAYLTQYILTQLPKRQDVERLINSRDTAVVLLNGLMPTAVSKNQYFDIRVAALPGTQTTSLEGGWLYGAELETARRFGMTMKALATAEGPVFIDRIDAGKRDEKTGYILGGGRVLDEYKISLALRLPNYRTASLIRDKLNERFGEGTAKAVSPSKIDLKVPAKYRRQKQRFISIIKATYLSETPEITQERISTFVRTLAVGEDKQSSEIALEAIGKESIDKLSALLNLSDEQARLRAARCMLNLGSDTGLDTLRQIAADKNSPYRVEALEVITRGASRNDAAAISRRLLRDDDFDIRLAAYEQLRRLDDITVAQTFVGRNFYLEQITQTEHKSIFASRSGQPRVVLFGAPIRCRKNIFVQSDDGSIIINAPAGQEYVSIIRKHPRRPNIPPIQLKSSFELGDIIRTLCEEPFKKRDEGQIGLGVSYAEAIALLKKMSDKGAVRAEFRAGPLPEIDLIIKKQQTIGR